MKKILVLALVILISFPTYAKIVIGKIDVPKVMGTINQGKKVNSKLKAQFKKWEKELKKEEANLRKAKESFDKQRLLKDQKWAQKKQEELQRKFIALQQKTQTYQQKIQTMEVTEKKPILEKIRVLVSEVSKKEKVDLTVETSASPILYAKDVIDLTSKVIALYNNRHK